MMTNYLFFAMVTLFLIINHITAISLENDNEFDYEKGRLSGFHRNNIKWITKGFLKLTTNMKKQLQKMHLVGNESSNDLLTKIANKLNPTIPGTLWCGAGNISKNLEDLGLFTKSDKCCKNHDNCPDNIPAGKTKANLINDGLFTRSHCQCDDEFFYCLRNVRSAVSLSIIRFYFHVLGPQCFIENPNNQTSKKRYIWRNAKKCYCTNSRQLKTEFSLIIMWILLSFWLLF